MAGGFLWHEMVQTSHSQYSPVPFGTTMQQQHPQDDTDRTNDDNSPDVNSMDRETFEEYALQRIEDAIWERLEDVVWDESFNLEKEEYDRLEEYTGYGPTTTTAIGLLTFGFLRGSRLLVRRHVLPLWQQRRHTPTAPPSPLVQSPPPVSPTGIPRPSLPLLQPTTSSSRNSSTFWTVVHIVVDIALSYTASLVAPLMLVDDMEVAQACVDMPVVLEKSTIADEFCPIVQRELTHLQQQQHKDVDVLEHPQSLYLQALVNFARNCQIRESSSSKHLRNNDDDNDDDDDDSFAPTPEWNDRGA